MSHAVSQALLLCTMPVLIPLYVCKLFRRLATGQCEEVVSRKVERGPDRGRHNIEPNDTQYMTLYITIINERLSISHTTTISITIKNEKTHPKLNSAYNTQYRVPLC